MTRLKACELKFWGNFSESIDRVAELRQILVCIEMILSVLQQLQGAASRAATNVGPGSGPTYGTIVHNAFQREVDALGNANLTTEQSYLNGNPVRRGTPGSVCLDVVEGPLDNPTSIYDLKTGSAKLTLARIQQIQSHLSGGSTVPITEVRQ